MNDQEYWHQIQTIIQTAKCDRITAIEALFMSFNTDDAIKKARESTHYIGGGSSGLAVQDNKKRIVMFKNGILIEEKFLSFNDKANLRLKSMLERKEFDASALGGKPGEDVIVKFFDLNEKEFIEDKYIKKPETQKNEKPIIKQAKSEFQDFDFSKEIVIDEQGSIIMKILIEGKKVSVRGINENKIKDVYDFLRKKCSKDFYFSTSKEKIDVNANLQMYKGHLIHLIFD
ncbi:hypothetical protein GVAV_001632 [Gurleya vavrai]